MKELPSREELCFIYKAIIRALIDYHGIKHSWIATRIGMRDDTFSRWFRNGRRSFTVEEMKLFCEAIKISSDTIDYLLNETLNFRVSRNSIADYVSRSTGTESVKNLTLLFGENGFAKIMLQINDYMKAMDVREIEFPE